jgi:hypothetical protein
MLGALLPSVALALNVAGEALPPARVPLEVHWSGTLRGFSEAELRATVEGAATSWVGSASCEVEITLVRDPEAHRGYQAGGVAVLFGDPQDMLAEGQRVVRTSVPPGCASRRCVTGSVDATAGGDTAVDTGAAYTAAPSDTGTTERGAGCGCGSDAGRGVSALLVGVAAAVVGRRRRYTP